MNNKCWVIVDDGIEERKIVFRGEHIIVTHRDSTREMSHGAGDVFLSEVEALRELAIRLRRKIQQNANVIRLEPPKRTQPFGYPQVTY